MAAEKLLVPCISKSLVSEWLRTANLKPHRVQAWLTSKDPEFDKKAAVIADLYFDPPPCSAIISIDEKPGMQALERRYATLPMVPGIPARVEFEYKRHGVLGLFGGFNIKTGEVLVKCTEQRKVVDFIEYLDLLAEKYPAGTVYCVLDNLNIHKNWQVEKWRARHHGRFVFVFTPTHASWLNQVECWFSILDRKCLRRGSFPSKAKLAEDVRGFTDLWNAVHKHPFNWSEDAKWVRSCRAKPQ